MRLRAVGVAAALVLGALSIPATAAPDGTITLEGSTSAWTTLDVPPGVTIHSERMVVSGKGRFAGFYVDAGSFDYAGAVWLRDYQTPGTTGGDIAGFGKPAAKIPRGRHRIYLVADGPTTVRVPVTGMASRTIRPARRTTAAATVQTLDRTTLGVRGRQPVKAAGRSVSFSSIMLSDVRVYAGTLSVCLTEPEGACNSGGWDSSRYAWFVFPQQAYTFVFTINYLPGAKSGRLDAVQAAQNVAGITYAMGASFTLALA